MKLHWITEDGTDYGYLPGPSASRLGRLIGSVRRVGEGRAPFRAVVRGEAGTKSSRAAASRHEGRAIVEHAADRSAGEASPVDEVIDGQDRLMTPGEVAALFRVDPKSVTRWAAAGRIGSMRTPGGHRRFRQSEVRALLEGQAALDEVAVADD